MSKPPVPSRDIDDLVAIMAALRTPGTGCPWDLEQDFASIAPYTVEEAHEVAEAISRNDLDDLKDELGDLLLQVVFHSRMAEEAGHFTFGDVVEAITGKLIRRHPHVFGEARHLPPDAVKALWGEIKAGEKAERALRRGLAPDAPQSVLAGVSSALPPAQRAVKLQDKAAAVGFDWPSPLDVVAKIAEEAAEIAEPVRTGDRGRVEEELGDLMFVAANLARHFRIDPDMAMAKANAKFTRRFGHVERALAARGLKPEQSSLSEMDMLWNEAKAAEKAAGPAV
jgi:nucleoside triphosphate diphosphatase